MSYVMRVTFRCDACGLELVTNTLAPPAGWLRPSGLSEQHGPHFCRDCVKRGLLAPPALVPIEVNPA